MDIIVDSERSSQLDVYDSLPFEGIFSYWKYYEVHVFSAVTQKQCNADYHLETFLQ